jgi:hypothetical protein
MYSPVLSEEIVKTLYRLKRVYRKPMTKIAEELIGDGLKAVDTNLICRVCIGERNNDCNDCCLNGSKEEEVEDGQQ